MEPPSYSKLYISLDDNIEKKNQSNAKQWRLQKRTQGRDV